MWFLVLVFIIVCLSLSTTYENMDSPPAVSNIMTDTTCSNSAPTKKYLNENPNRLYTSDDLINLVASINKIDMGTNTLKNDCLNVTTMKKVHDTSGPNVYYKNVPEYISKDNIVAMDTCEFSPNRNPLNPKSGIECFGQSMPPDDKLYLMICSVLTVGLLYVASGKLSMR